MQKTIRITLGLGILSVLGIFMSHLALTDIFHGEADLTLEWKALQISFLAIVTFHVSAIYTLIRILRQNNKETTA
jgi:hypothetical protein